MFEEHYLDELQRRIKNINICENCGERDIGKKKYCDFCSTAEKRREMELENEAIKKENLSKGFIYADNRNKQAVL